MLPDRIYCTNAMNLFRGNKAWTCTPSTKIRSYSREKQELNNYETFCQLSSWLTVLFSTSTVDCCHSNGVVGGWIETRDGCLSGTSS